MLKCVVVVLNVVVVVVGVGQEVMIQGKHIGRAHVGAGQAIALRLEYLINLLGVVTQVLAQLVAQVGIGVLVADNLDGIVHADGAMVGGDNYLIAHLGHALEQLDGITGAEPRLGERAVGTVGVGQLAYHLALGASVRHHVDKVDDYHIEVEALE